MGKDNNAIAAEKALEYIEKNPGWVRICDLQYDCGLLYQTFSELPVVTRAKFYQKYGHSHAEAAWKEYGAKVCKVPKVYIDQTGRVHIGLDTVKPTDGIMTMYKPGNFKPPTSKRK